MHSLLFLSLSLTTTTDSPLLLPALRLFIPPLRLVSAAMWHVVQRGSVQDYGMVEEFVSTVSEMVPELLNADQKAQLLLGLRARVGVYTCQPTKILNKGDLSCEKRVYSHCWKLMTLNQVLMLNLPGEDV